MSICRTSYLLYGFRLKSDKDQSIIEDHYDELMDDKPYSDIFNNDKSDQIIVDDNMCGTYTYIGINLAELDEDEDDRYVEINESELLNLKAKLESYMKSWPDYLLNLLKRKKPNLYFFIHAC